MSPRKAGLVSQILLAFSTTLSAGALPRPLLEAALPITSAPVQDASVVFISDESLRVLLIPRSRNQKSTIAGFRIGPTGLAEEGRVTAPGQDIFSASGGNVIVRSGARFVLYTPDLRTSLDVPISGGVLREFISTPYPLTRVLGASSQGGWLTVRLIPTMPIVAQGTGYLLATSDERFLSRRADALRIEDADKKQLGSISIAADAHDRVPLGMTPTTNRIAEFAGPGRVMLSYGQRDRIVDFTGKSISSIRPPPGWGFRHAWSADGSRMLYDHFAIPFPRAIRSIDSILSALVPVPPPEQNREELTVVDTLLGSNCFRLQQYNRLYPLFVMHGDISPSGRLLAVISADKLSVYELPAYCRAQ